MTSTTQYDAMVIGAGQAGERLSTALARAGTRERLLRGSHLPGQGPSRHFLS
jgi:cation diffusion facilitator CzcD-associated flavoprotein CzcO